MPKENYFKMKIYLAATAPGNEKNGKMVGKLPVKRRLLNYYLIINKKLESEKVFNFLKK
jgi:hypothetical protein